MLALREDVEVFEMGHKPTPEQEKILDGTADGSNGVIEAGAGTGKTSTLEMFGRAHPRQQILYVAYNKAIAGDAAKRFPGNVQCRTAHSLAYAEIGKLYRGRLNGPRVPARQAAAFLGIRDRLAVADDAAPLAPAQVARIAIDTVNRFAYSADAQIERHHVPKVNGLDDPPTHAVLQRLILPYARRAWEDIVSEDGKLKFTHDYYLKLWGLSDPFIDADVVLLDEAQDSNPVVAKIVEDQGHAQQVLVGDRCQAIYMWRGSVDAMQNFSGERYYLSQSFRFGPAIAAEANKWLGLETLQAELRLTGFDKIPSVLAELDLPDAVLCRTNARAVETVMDAYDRGRVPALVGGGDQIKRLAEAAVDLKAGRGTSHPELFAFQTWAELEDYVENDSGGSDLAAFVRLVDKYDAETVIDVCDRLVDEKYADLVVSTSHRAKGREWPKVRIADDFREPKVTEKQPVAKVTREDAMLAYVAVTRAQLVLDRGGLAWVDKFVTEPTEVPEPTEPVKVDDGIIASLSRPSIALAPPAVALPSAASRRALDDLDVESTCACDPAEAEKWSQLIGQPAGKSVAHCARCGGGRLDTAPRPATKRTSSAIHPALRASGYTDDPIDPLSASHQALYGGPFYGANDVSTGSYDS